MTNDELEEVLQNPKIVSNRLKVCSVRKNAVAMQKDISTNGSFAKYIWSFVNDVPIDSARKTMTYVPAATKTFDAMSKELKKSEFAFVGSTICYALM